MQEPHFEMRTLYLFGNLLFSTRTFGIHYLARKSPCLSNGAQRVSIIRRRMQLGTQGIVAFEGPVIYTTLRSQCGEPRPIDTNTRMERSAASETGIGLLRHLRDAPSCSMTEIPIPHRQRSLLELV